MSPTKIFLKIKKEKTGEKRVIERENGSFQKDK